MYYDPTTELVLEVVISKDGVGAVIMQDGKLFEYASRALTPTERKWAQIEKEALAVLFGVQRFDQYIYGCRILLWQMTTILRKPLSSAYKGLKI